MGNKKEASSGAMLGKRGRQAELPKEINPPAEEAQLAPGKRTKIPIGKYITCS